MVDAGGTEEYTVLAHRVARGHGIRHADAMVLFRSVGVGMHVRQRKEILLLGWAECRDFPGYDAQELRFGPNKRRDTEEMRFRDDASAFGNVGGSDEALAFAGYVFESVDGFASCVAHLGQVLESLLFGREERHLVRECEGVVCEIKLCREMSKFATTVPWLIGWTGGTTGCRINFGEYSPTHRLTHGIFDPAKSLLHSIIHDDNNVLMYRQ